MNIHAHFSVISKKLVRILVLDLKDVDFIRKLKNVYLIPIVINLLLQLVNDIHYISENTMLSDTIINFDQNYKKDFDQRYEKKLIRK